MCAFLISDHHQQIENVKHKASIGKHFVFTLFFLFNNVWSFVLSLSDKPQGFFVIRIGTVDQKSIKWKRQSKSIDKHMSVYVWEREKKGLMQFEYCRQLLSKTNDKYYLIYIYIICICLVWRLRIGIEWWQVEIGKERKYTEFYLSP